MKIIYIFLFSTLSTLLFSELRPSEAKSSEAASCIDISILSSAGENSEKKKKYDQERIYNCFNKKVQEIKEFFDKNNSGRMEVEFEGGRCVVVPLSKKYVYLEQEAHKELEYLGVPDFIAKNLLVLDMCYKKFLNHDGNQSQDSGFLPCGKVLHWGPVPYALLINTQELEKLGTNRVEFVLFHLTAHVYLLLKEYHEKLDNNPDPYVTNQTREALADSYALLALIRRCKDEKWRPGIYNSVRCNFANDLWSWASNKVERSKEYLQPKELVCYIKRIFEMHDKQEKIDQSNFLKIAKNHIDSRKMKNYEEDINEEFMKFLQLFEKNKLSKIKINK